MITDSTLQLTHRTKNTIITNLNDLYTIFVHIFTLYVYLISFMNFHKSFLVSIHQKKNIIQTNIALKFTKTVNQDKK